MGPEGRTWTFTPQTENFPALPQRRKFPSPLRPQRLPIHPFSMPTLKFAVLAGDYIGPEVMSEALRVLGHVAGLEKFTLDPHPADVGGAGIDNHGKALPDSTLRTCEGSDAILF